MLVFRGFRHLSTYFSGKIDEMLKKTPLTTVHKALNAKMAAFAGYEMPIVYTSIKQEHIAVRQAVGLFDVSHMGEFVVTGNEALDLVQWLTSNDAAKLKIGQAQYSCLPNNDGGIVDDLIVYRFGEQKFMLVVNAANAEKDLKWINNQNKFDAVVTDKSDEYALLALQGPKSIDVLQQLTSVDLNGIKFYHFAIGAVCGIDNILISATGYTGEKGFELYCKNEHAQLLWTTIMEAGKDFGIEPVGLAARDTLRLEKGYCLYGNDIDGTINPLEAGLGWITKLNAKDFVGKSKIEAVKENGIIRKLVGFELIDKGIARSEYDVLDENGNKIGRVTSGTQSPTLGKSIGLAYVPIGLSKIGTIINIQIRKKVAKAKVVKTPFV